MRRRAIAPVLFALSLMAFGIAWVLGNPPGAGPDESGHFVKAVAAARGDVVGKPTRLTASEVRAAGATLSGTGQSRVELERFLARGNAASSRWAFRTAREFSIPAALANPSFGCGLGQPTVSAACLEEEKATGGSKEVDSLFGTYQPFLHLGPGLATLAVDDAATALRLSRLVNAVLSLGLIAVAALALWDRGDGALSVTGLVVAVTPSVISFSSALTPSGPEIAAGICLTACLLRLTRDAPAPIWVWVAVGASGAVLGSARTLGAVFAAALVIGVAALAGPRRVRAALAGGRSRAGLGAGAATMIGAAAGLWWELAYQPRAPFELGEFLDGIGPSVRGLWNITKESIGVFSALDTPLPAPAYAAWLLMLALLLAAAVAVSGRRDRLALALLALAVAAVTVLAYSVYRQTGNDLQARHILPVAVVLPLFAGELLHRNAGEPAPRPARQLLACLAMAAGVVQALAFYVYCRRFAVGTDGGWMFLDNAEWSPPLGWVPWLLLAAAGALAYGAAGWTAAAQLSRRSSASSPSSPPRRSPPTAHPGWPLRRRPPG